MLYYSYCRGASSPVTCGVNGDNLIAVSDVNSVSVYDLPYQLSISNAYSYPSCYYTIQVTPYVWKSGKISL
jgi:hypothetical protein